MEGTLRLLMLTDIPDDVTWIGTVLQGAGVAYELRVVSDLTDLPPMFDVFVPTAIVCDYDPGQQRLMDALQICRRRQPLTPFLFVTDAALEQHAEAILKAGADDYILKQHIRRLPMAITQAIERKNRQDSLRKSEEGLQKLNDALHKEKELVEMKSKFVSIASHEFRTPLSVIARAADALGEKRNTLSADKFDEHIARIKQQVLHMTHLLDDLLTIGKADAGKIDPHYTVIVIKEFFGQLVLEVEQSYVTHKIDLQIDCAVKTIRSDEKLLRNIVLNLLTNAIKFSPGQTTVYVTISNTPDLLTVKVEDNGIGILKEDLANIFTAFHRGSNVDKIQGTGLGLSIVKKAVDLLDGEIKVQRKPRRGTVISVMLPLSELPLAH